ncbi:MAG: NADH-quinone oxidoreductase subunit H [Actinomycetia bacterium]|nr:NADH-quinone oxidoreductase subunit H [Actinomycetes bacterium]
MLIILKKIAYILIIVAANLYICSYLGAKLSARMELRRGYRMARTGGIGFPAKRLLSYLAGGQEISIWGFILFVFSLLIWAVVPINADLALVDMDSSLIVAFLFYLIIIVLNLSSQSGTRYSIVFGQMVKKIISVISLAIPFFFSTVSIVLLNRTLSLREIVDLQHEYWNIAYQPLGFIIALMSTIMVLKILWLNRKGTLEISGINKREGTGLSRAVLRFSEYSIVLFMTYMLVILYMGGYKNLYFIRGDVMLGIKFYALFIFILFSEKALGSSVSDTGLLMRINGKFLIPLSMVNFIITFGFFIYRNIDAATI